MTIKPLNGFLIVKLIEQEKSAGGIHLPNGSPEFMRRGTVITIGDGEVERHQLSEPRRMKVQSGDVVYFAPNTPIIINYARQYYLLHHDNVVAVEVEEPTSE